VPTSDEAKTCPTCGAAETVFAIERFGVSTFYCAACEHDWDEHHKPETPPDETHDPKPSSVAMRLSPSSGSRKQLAVSTRRTPLVMDSFENLQAGRVACGEIVVVPGTTVVSTSLLHSRHFGYRLSSGAGSHMDVESEASDWPPVGPKLLVKGRLVCVTMHYPDPFHRNTLGLFETDRRAVSESNDSDPRSRNADRRLQTLAPNWPASYNWCSQTQLSTYRIH
jgi:hypothetical protein